MGQETPFWYIIANPVAGGGRVLRRWPQVEQLLQQLGIAYTVQFTQYRGHALELVDTAVLNGHRHLLAMGGDGTWHEVCNGVLRQPHAASTDIMLGLIPSGTGNDWARQYHIPQRLTEWIPQLKQPAIAMQDAGWIDYTDEQGQTQRRWFVNVAGMAYDGYVTSRLEQHGKPRNPIGYLASVARYLFEYEPAPARVEFDDAAPVEDHFYTINIGVCKYSGGGMQLVPHAVPDDGLLALTLAKSIPKWSVMLQTPRFYRGTLLEHPRISGYQVQRLRVTPLSDQPLLFETDGDFVGAAPVEIGIQARCLRVVVPKSRVM
jgi:diacylglycerol kinase (ATP)